MNIYLKAYANDLDLQKDLIEYFDLYNYSRFHDSLSNMNSWRSLKKTAQLSTFILFYYRRKKKQKRKRRNTKTIIII